MRGADVPWCITTQQWASDTLTRTHTESGWSVHAHYCHTVIPLLSLIQMHADFLSVLHTHTHTPICRCWMNTWPPCCRNNSECYSILLTEERKVSTAAPAGSQRTRQAILVSLWYPIGGLTSSLDHINPAYTHKHKAGVKLSLSYTLYLNYHKISSFVCVCPCMSVWVCMFVLEIVSLLRVVCVCVSVCVCVGQDDLVISWVGCSAGASLVWFRWGLEGVCVCVWRCRSEIAGEMGWQ